MKFQKGQKAWNKNKKRYWKTSGDFKKGQIPWNKGKKHTEETKKKMSNARIGKYSREKCNLWKGGITPINKLIRTSARYKKWRMAVFIRDNFTCQFCNKRNHIGLGKSIYLEAHHIKSFADFPELRFVLENGVTLCLECHKLTKKRIHKE